MKIDDQIKTLKKRKLDLYNRWCKPLDAQILNLENIQTQLKKQNTLDFDTQEQADKFERLNNPFEFKNRPELTTWERLERGKGL